MDGQVKMQRKLLSGLFWVLLLNLLVKPFWILGIETGVQRAVGNTEYGIYFAIFNLAYIFNILLDMGITSFNTRNIAQKPEQIESRLGGILCVKVLLLGVYIIVTFAAGLLLGYGSRQFLLLAILCFNQFLNSLILYLRSNFEGLLLFRWDSVISVLDRGMMIVICGLLLWLPDSPAFRIEYFVYAQTAAYLITAAVALAVLVRKTGVPHLRFDRLFTLATLRQSAPFALLVLLMASYNRIDPILLQRLAADGSSQAGVYAVAFRLLDALTMIAYLVSVPLLPIFAKLVADADGRGQLPGTLRLVTSLMLAFSIAAATTFAGMDRQLMELLYPDSATASAPVFRVIIWGIIPISMTYVYGTLLTADGRLRQLNIFATSALVINVAANLILIPRMGARGSAWASLAAQSFMAAAQMVAALRRYHIAPPWGYLFKIALYILAVLAVSSLCLHFGWWQRLLLMAAAAIMLAMIMKLIDIKQIKTILLEQ